MIRCEDKNIHFDRTKLDKLTEILERLNKEDEDLKKTDINEELAENQKRREPRKKKQTMTLGQQLTK